MLYGVHHVILVIASFLTDRLPLRVFMLVEPLLLRAFAVSQWFARAGHDVFTQAGIFATAARRARGKR